MDISKQHHLPPPFEIIERVVKTSVLTRAHHIEAKIAVKAWYASLGVPVQSITEVLEESDQMQFADYQLDQEAMIDAQEWMSNEGVDIGQLINQTVLEGYRITFTYDFTKQCFMTSLIGKSSDNPNRGLCMSTRHSSVAMASALAMYKQHVVFHNGPWGDMPKNSLFG